MIFNEQTDSWVRDDSLERFFLGQQARITDTIDGALRRIYPERMNRDDLDSRFHEPNHDEDLPQKPRDLSGYRVERRS